MDGRAGVQPTETNGSVGNDDHSGTPASTNGSKRPRPLTIREVVRRGRRDLDEIDRLRGEVDRLRIRAESAEQLLGSGPDVVTASGLGHVATNGNAHNGNGHSPNGNGKNGNGKRANLRNGKAPSSSDRSNAGGWATAAVVPPARES